MIPAGVSLENIVIYVRDFCNHLDSEEIVNSKDEKPFYHGHRQRLRDRFLKDGFKGFAPHEVVELLLTLAIPQRDVKKPAHALIERFGSIQGVLDASPSELRETLGGQNHVAPVALKIIKETADLYLQQRAEERVSLATPETLYDFWRSRTGVIEL